MAVACSAVAHTRAVQVEQCWVPSGDRVVVHDFRAVRVGAASRDHSASGGSSGEEVLLAGRMPGLHVEQVDLEVAPAEDLLGGHSSEAVPSAPCWEDLACAEDLVEESPAALEVCSNLA